MNGLLVLLVRLWCWHYNRRWLRRGEQQYFLKQLERQHDKLIERWDATFGSTKRGRHALREG